MTDELKFFDPETGKPPLPTEPGAMIRAVNTEGAECAVMTRSQRGFWRGLDQKGTLRAWTDEEIREWEPVTLVPTETWERLRVLDPEDKRDRVDARGDAWVYDQQPGGWLSKYGERLLDPYFINDCCGPLRFADEVSSDE